MKKILFACLVFLLISVPVLAADDTFTKLDRDGNGRIDRQEYLDSASRQFKELDRNKDGSIDRKEVRIGAPGWKGRFNELDADKDGRISKEEFTRGALDDFDLLDSNKDGAIDRSEFEASRNKQTTRDPDVKKRAFILFNF